MKRLVRATILLATWSWLSAGFVAFAEGLPTAKPEEVGLSDWLTPLQDVSAKSKIADQSGIY